ncbi:MAG: hypothetical protein Q8K67_00105 [Geothrix sp.]|nr:hypothetical protein [Geothrix sp.]
MGTNDFILIVVALFFSYLLLAIHYEQKRTTDRRKRNLGPPDGSERRSGQDRRHDSLMTYLGWVFRSQFRRLVGLFKSACWYFNPAV